MATGNEYRQFILDQLADVPGIRMRPMMGEYLLYVRENWWAACTMTECW